MKNNRKVDPIVYIDGQNFMFKIARVLIAEKIIKSKGDLERIDVKHLIGRVIDEKRLVIRYYGAKLKIFKQSAELEEKTRKIVNSQRVLISALSRQGVEFRRSGKLKLRDGDVCKKCKNQDMHLQEKGVDVSIAVDMIVESEKGRTMYLVSSDTDLLPAVLRAKKKGVNIVYVGFAEHRTHALVNIADSVILIRNKEILEAFYNLTPPKLLK